MEELNPQQQIAVEHVEGPALVIAGAGAGKTRIVTQRIVNLLGMGVPAGEILAVTFTNKAAQEMRERVNSVSDQHVLISTFHSLGTRILRESIELLGYGKDFVIYDEEDSLKLIKACLDELGVRKKELKPKVFRGLISNAKNSFVMPGEVDRNTLASEAELIFPELYALYQSRLKEYNAVDFDDLLLLTVKLLKEHGEAREMYQRRWSFVLVDEYQDTNQPQYLLARLLVERSNNLFVVGDPDQSIYSWRGANIGNILGFEEDFPGAKIIQLEQNYRTPNVILSASNALIQNNQGRYEKNLWSDLGEGEPVRIVRCMSDREEADFVVSQLAAEHRAGIPFSEIVVFYRTNSQSRQFEDGLLRRRIPYVIVGGLSFYQRKEVKDILAYLRIVESGSDFLAFARSLGVPKRGIGDVTLDKLRVGAIEAGLPIFPFCEQVVAGETELKLSPRAKSGLEEYVRHIRSLREMKEESPLARVVSEAIHSSGYLGFLKEDPETFQDRKENLEELVSKAAEWGDGTLGAFLEELSLKSTLDETTAEDDRVRLMTIHNGKGLEFQLVFLVGMEEGLFPHINSQGRAEALEEERRLCYVGMTRAKQKLYMSCAGYRHIWGTPQVMRPSRFLGELPMKYCSEGEEEPDVPQIEETSGVFEPGDRVQHKDFGIGVIEAAHDSSLGRIYKIFFQRQQKTKTIVAKYARLVRADN
jgi:ATP-dependent DNA helicase UvrD/PcrA